jgi:hypothetical protein
MDISATNRMTYWCPVLLLANWVSRRGDAVVDRAGLSNEAGSLPLRLWDKSNNFTHARSKQQFQKEFCRQTTNPPKNDDSHLILMWDVNSNLEALQAVTK